jgi:hypothetical protein
MICTARRIGADTCHATKPTGSEGDQNAEYRQPYARRLGYINQVHVAEGPSTRQRTNNGQVSQQKLLGKSPLGDVPEASSPSHLLPGTVQAAK